VVGPQTGAAPRSPGRYTRAARLPSCHGAECAGEQCEMAVKAGRKRRTACVSCTACWQHALELSSLAREQECTSVNDIGVMWRPIGRGASRPAARSLLRHRRHRRHGHMPGPPTRLCSGACPTTSQPAAFLLVFRATQPSQVSQMCLPTEDGAGSEPALPVERQDGTALPLANMPVGHQHQQWCSQVN
jgi:hypothetical protein